MSERPLMDRAARSRLRLFRSWTVARVLMPSMLVLTLVSQATSASAQRDPHAEKSPSAVATRRLADDVVAGIKRHEPEWGTYLGLPDAEHGRVTDNSLHARAKWRAEEDAWRKRLAAIDGRTLDGRPEWVIRGFLDELLQTSLENRVCETELWHVDQIVGWQSYYGQLAQLQPIETEARRELALARFQALSTFVDREIANLREGLRKGYSAPRGNVEQVIKQMDGFVADSSPYFSPAERTKVSSFVSAWRKMVQGELAPAFRRYQAFLRTEYLPHARESVAVSALPSGAACYRARLRQMTTRKLTAADVHKTGLQELERVKAEERRIAERLFSNPDLESAFAQLERPEYRWENREAVIAHARTAVTRAQAAMPRWFGRLPKTRVIVTPIPAAEEPTARDRYWPGSIDGKRAAEYQINAAEWIGLRKGDLEAVVFHETIPGHHLELTLSLERPGTHLIAKLVSTAAFREGWGLYAERLADEMNLYTSDVYRLGMWQGRAFRAARLVVDTGLHEYGWSRQRAIDFMKALHLGSGALIASEVDRYIIWPGQATAYMMGALEIERLRSEVQQRLGSRFDLRSFHDALLEDGPVPLPMLRAKMERIK
jgi:uncharacterized protein (DUF885 family)